MSLTVEKTGEEPFREAVKNWTGVRLGICSLMLKRNEEAFRQFVSNKTGLVSRRAQSVQAGD